MKFLLFLTVIVIAAILFFSFWENFGQSIRFFENGKSSSSTTPYNDRMQLGKNSGAAGSSTPPGFQGPIDKPHIIGPSANPPDY